ncbi:MAG: helix-hairpin-helix domain-containing protein [Emergencia sp.]
MEQLLEKSKKYMEKCREHRQIISAAAIILIVIAAVVFFGDYGEKDEIPVQFLQEEEANGLTEDSQISEGTDKQAGDDTEEEMSVSRIYVDISGQVKRPGVYQVDEGTRMFEVIEEAGGLLSTAQIDQVNQAEVVTDGQKIVIPKEGEEGEMTEGPVSEMSGGLININTADSQALQEISGVGPATAEKIIDYRNQNGRFRKKEDLKNVSGIGEKTFEKIKDKITV